MKADAASPSHDSPSNAPGEAVRTAAIAAILLLALGVRVFYAYGLPLNGDETVHLQEARKISLRPESFHLPLDSPVSSHPLTVVYLTALADWAGGGNVFVIRLAFIAISLIGLVGLYVLAASMFGPRVALVALALAAVDRHLVALAPVFLESPSVTFLAPWTILLMHRCLVRGLRRDWLLLGLLVGLGYWISTVFLVMLLPFGLYILLTGRLVRVLKSRWMYAGLGVTAAMMLPFLLSDLRGGGVNYGRNVDKVGSLGLSPRMALLYVGDLLICLKDPTWIANNIGGKMYLPVYVPCNWVMGLVYMAVAAVSLRFWRDERILLLLLVIVGFLIPVTLLDAREPWNEFTWASSTVFAAILLTAFLIERMWSRLWGKVMAATILAYALGALVWFLAGPKWGYFCPEWERAYTGRMLALVEELRRNPPQSVRNRLRAEIRQLTGPVIARHPESAVAWYFRGLAAETAAGRSGAFQRALELDPNNPLVVERQAYELLEAGEWVRARRLLEGLLAEDRESDAAYEMLAELEYSLGDYASAAVYARRLVAARPEEDRPYRHLFVIYQAMGEEAKAEASLRAYAVKHPEGPAAAYVSLAEDFWKEGKSARGRALLERAIRAEPRRAEDHDVIGFLLAQKLNDTDRAIEHLRAAARLGSTNPVTYYNLASAVEKKGHFARAIGYYERAIQLDPDFGEAHVRLGNLLAKQNRIAEAKAHWEAAARLGVISPRTYHVLPEPRKPRESGP